jgi:hypothetical protein
MRAGSALSPRLRRSVSAAHRLELGVTRYQLPQSQKPYGRQEVTGAAFLRGSELCRPAKPRYHPGHLPMESHPISAKPQRIARLYVSPYGWYLLRRPRSGPAGLTALTYGPHSPTVVFPATDSTS